MSEDELELELSEVLQKLAEPNRPDMQRRSLQVAAMRLEKALAEKRANQTGNRSKRHEGVRSTGTPGRVKERVDRSTTGPVSKKQKSKAGRHEKAQYPRTAPAKAAAPTCETCGQPKEWDGKVGWRCRKCHPHGGKRRRQKRAGGKKALDDRDYSTSVRTVSGGLPTLGRRHR